MAAAVLRAVRSENIRLRRMWMIPAAALVLTVVVTAVSFTGTSPGGPTTRAATATGAGTSSATTLTDPDGIITGVTTAATLVALLCLVLWALSIARDVQTGSIRILLVTQARRGVYLAGKLAALGIVTVVTTAASVALSVGVAYIVAPINNVSTGAWRVGAAASAIVNLALTALLWGAIGGLLAMLFRSSAAAIATGVGYLLLGEKLIGLVWDTSGSWLPSGAADNLLNGSGTPTYHQALALTVVYLATSLTGTVVHLCRRDITD